MTSSTVDFKTRGLRIFTIIWIGQVFSLLGTSMSNFGLTLWAYDVTQKATPLALIGFAFVTPMTLLGPFIGVLVDRGNRKLMMLLSDLTAASVSLIILILLKLDLLQVWQLYPLAFIAGVMQGFQWPAYSATISLMLPKQHYARANAMLELAAAGSGVLAPLLAGSLIGSIGLQGLLLIDLCTASLAVLILLLSPIPQPEVSEEGLAARGTFLHELGFGFRYIFQRPGLLGLQLVFMGGNFFNGLAYAVFPAMILARTQQNAVLFGQVNALGAVGGVLGGLLMSFWGGPKKRVHGVLLGWVLTGLFAQSLLGMVQSLLGWSAGLLIGGLTGPLINGSNQAIWQAKVPPDLQGRVFGTRRFIAWLVSPLAQLLAGPLADKVFEPALLQPGAWSWLVGSGPGAGMGLLFVLTGLAAALVGAAGYLFPAVREVETLLPDHAAVMEG